MALLTRAQSVGKVSAMDDLDFLKKPPQTETTFWGLPQAAWSPVLALVTCFFTVLMLID